MRSRSGALEVALRVTRLFLGVYDKSFPKMGPPRYWRTVVTVCVMQSEALAFEEFSPLATGVPQGNSSLEVVTAAILVVSGVL